MPQSMHQVRRDHSTELIHYLEGQPGRAQIEEFIRHVYAEKFHADVQSFAPILVALYDAQGSLVAAAGYRPAESGPLFLERYLTEPVHQLLLSASHGAPDRRTIVEVGHLAATRPGLGRLLICSLAPYLAQAGFEWVVSTMTQELRHLFVRMGIVPLALGPADPMHLGESFDKWGTYYEHAPVVLAGQISQATKRLSRTQVLT